MDIVEMTVTTAPENKVNVPKARRTSWKKCGKHQTHNVTLQEGLRSSVCPQKAALQQAAE